MNRTRALDGVALAGLALYSATAGVSIAASQIGFGVALAAWAVSILQGERRFEATGLEPYFLAYLAAELVSFACSTNHAQNLIYMRRLLLIPLVWVVADRVRSPRDLVLVMVPLIAVADLLAIWGIAQYLSSHGGLGHRVRLLQHVLTTSGILMMVGLLCLGLAVTARTRSLRLGSAASLLLIGSCLVFTYSRSAWLGLIAGTLVVVALRKPRALFLAPIVVLGGYAILPAPLRERLLSAFDPSNPFNVERVNMWRFGIRIVRDHPWTGVGDIGLGDLYQRYHPPGAREMVSHLHDNLIMLAVTLGIPGALVVIALFVRILVLIGRQVRALAPSGGPFHGITLGALAAVAAFLVMGLFEWNFGDAEAAMMLWFTVGLSVAAGRMAEREARARVLLGAASA